MHARTKHGPSKLERKVDMTVFRSGADEDGETCTRVCLTGGPELLHNGAREEDSKEKVVGGQEVEGKEKLCSMDMVVFDCEDEEESRPTAAGNGAFNFGCLDGVDCTMYLVGYRIKYSGKEGRHHRSWYHLCFGGRRQSMVYFDHDRVLCTIDSGIAESRLGMERCA